MVTPTVRVQAGDFDIAAEIARLSEGAGAVVTFSNSTTGRAMGSQTTDALGNATYRVPVGVYELSVVWQEAPVHSSEEIVETDRVLVVTAAVYYAYIRTIDTQGWPSRALR